MRRRGARTRKKEEKKTFCFEEHIILSSRLAPKPPIMATLSLLLLLLLACFSSSDDDCVFANKRSQQGQDAWVASLFSNPQYPLSPRRQRTFVELGANDGVTFSNSYLLERCHGWRGVCIEPTPSAFAKLLQSGRDRCHMVRAPHPTQQCPYLKRFRKGRANGA